MGQKDLRGKLLEDYEDVFSDKPWNDTKTLHSIMNIPEEFKSYVQDYKVMVFDIAFLEDEVIERFTSDFKLIAKFFKNKRLGKQDLFDDDKINHIQEVMDFLAVFTDDDRYKEIKPKLVKIEKEGRPVRMCNVAQALEEKGIEQGKIITLYNLYKDEILSLETAAKKASMTANEFLATAKKYTN